MRFLILGDLHGQIPTIPDERFDAVLAVGDFCATERIQPHVWEAYRRHLADEDSEDTWWTLMGEDDARAAIKESYSSGRAVLEFLNGLGKPVFLIPGNWDWHAEGEADLVLEELLGEEGLWEELIAGLDNIYDCHDALITFEDVQIIGYGDHSGPEVPPDPSDRDALDEEVYDAARLFYTHIFNEAEKPVIFLSHNVPYGTRLDIIDNPDSPRDGEHRGSVLTRDLVRAHHPVITIGGHMHEHFGKDDLDGNVCINAGYGEVYTLLTVEDGRILELDFRPAPYG